MCRGAIENAQNFAEDLTNQAVSMSIQTPPPGNLNNFQGLNHFEHGKKSSKLALGIMLETAFAIIIYQAS